MRLGPVAFLLAGDVPAPDPHAGLERRVIELIRGDDPRDLEIEAVGVAPVQRLRGAVIAGAGEGVVLGQDPAESLEFRERVHLPRQVVETDRSLPGIVLPKATIVQEPPPPSGSEPVRVVGIVKEGVGRPRNDGTRGSALYAVPVRLSRSPSRLWTELFLRCWDRPPEWTTMHRPGIARVSGDRIIRDGTTMDELEKYHAKTLRLCVDTVNEQEEAIIERERVKQEGDEAARRQHEREVDEIADRIRFDD